MLRQLIPLGTEASATTLLFSWFSIVKTSAESDLSFFNGVLAAELFVVTLLLGLYSSNLRTFIWGMDAKYFTVTLVYF